MPLYVGDYLSKTQRLTLAEHGAYLLLIMEYWQSGGLPDDDGQLARICRTTLTEWKKLKQTLSTFFHDGWHHNRIDEELAKANAKHERRVEAGKRGGNASAQNKQTDSNATSNANSFAQASSSEPQSEKDKSPPSVAPPNKPDDDVREAVRMYAEVALANDTGWPGVQRLTAQRSSACRQRLAEVGGLEGWRSAMERAARSSFLTGGNDKGWRADFDFFCQSKSFTKLMEGSYDDRSPVPSARTNAHDAIFGALADAAVKGSGNGGREASPDGIAGHLAGPAPSVAGPNPDLEIPAFMRRG